MPILRGLNLVQSGLRIHSRASSVSHISLYPGSRAARMCGIGFVSALSNVVGKHTKDEPKSVLFTNLIIIIFTDPNSEVTNA